jgi:hypothetical protein
VEESGSAVGEETDRKSVRATWVSSSRQCEAVIDENFQKRPINKDVNNYNLCLVEWTGHSIRLKMAVVSGFGEVWANGRVEA